ncbi:hypothetical protein C4J81_00735 [Deltaproteobacteria bacterium Smac51]|nr:hypothetical protein C4J81_00735 [Deltaproteobacteria bacterium Smac51]
MLLPSVIAKSGRRVRSGLRPGLTLVELLIVVLVSFLVMMVAFTLFQTNSRYYLRQDAMLEQMQNLRVAMYTVSRDIRMAGNGFNVLGPDVKVIQLFIPSEGERDAGWFQYKLADGRYDTSYGIRPAYGVDGGSDGSDTLTLFRAEPESGLPIGRLSHDFRPGQDRIINLQEALVENTIESGDVIALVNGSRAVVLEVASLGNSLLSLDSTIRLENGKTRKARFYPTIAIDEIPSFPSGSNIYNLRKIHMITYSLDSDNNRLMANYYEPDIRGLDDVERKMVAVAEDIEDFQVRFVFNNTTDPDRGEDTDLDITRFRNNRVRAIQVGMVSKSALKDKDNHLLRPLELFNHTEVGEADSYPRRVLTETIYLRNYNK